MKAGCIALPIQAPRLLLWTPPGSNIFSSMFNLLSLWLSLALYFLIDGLISSFFTGLYINSRSITMFLLIPTVKLFSSRVYCLANFLYTCPAIVSCSYPTYLTIFSVLGCSCLSCLPSGFSVYLSPVLFQYNVCCFVCRINYPWRMSLMLPLSFPLTSFDLRVRPLLLTIY